MPTGCTLPIAAAIAVIFIAILNAAASYMANYFTESVGQWVANDLRMRTYHHLQYLSLRYYDTHQSGVLLSTITADVLTIQNFASSATLGILVDMFTILGMLVVMFFLNWDFTLIAVAHHAIAAAAGLPLQEGGQEINPRSTQTAEQHRRRGAAGSRIHPRGHGLRQAGTGTARTCGGQPGDRRRRAQGASGQGPALAHRLHHRLILRRLRTLARLSAHPHGGMTAGELTVFLSYLASFFKPVKDLASMNNSIAQTAVAVERIRTILDADAILPEKPNAREQEIHGEITFDHVAFAYDPAVRCCAT